MAKKKVTPKKVARKKPTASAKTKARQNAVGKEMRRILQDGGTKTVTKKVFIISPKKALAQASKNVKRGKV